MMRRTLLTYSIALVLMLSIATVAQRPRQTPRENLPGLIPPPLEYRDVLIASVRRTGQPRAVKGGIELPFRVVVRNLGTLSTGKFKVSVEYTTPEDDGEYAVVQFLVPDNAGTWFPITNRLAGGASITFDGTLKFPAGLQRAMLRVTADSCVQDLGLPASCRVEEPNEQNNTSIRWVVLR